MCQAVLVVLEVGCCGACMKSGPARGFGYTVFGALLIQVYGIF